MAVVVTDFIRTLTKNPTKRDPSPNCKQSNDTFETFKETASLMMQMNESKI